MLDYSLPCDSYESGCFDLVIDIKDGVETLQKHVDLNTLPCGSNKSGRLDQATGILGWAACWLMLRRTRTHVTHMNLVALTCPSCPNRPQEVDTKQPKPVCTVALPIPPIRIIVSFFMLCQLSVSFALSWLWLINKEVTHLYSGNMHSGIVKLNLKRLLISFGWNINQSNSRNIRAGRMNHTFFDAWCVGCWIRLSIWKRSDGCPRSGLHTIVCGITQDHPLIALLCQS